jgi:PAS domain S-box-containing protein
MADYDLDALKAYCKDDEAFQKVKAEFENLLDAQDEKVKELKQKEQYLRLVLDLDPNFIFARDKTGAFKLANQALAASFGMSPEDLIGKKDSDFIDDPEEVQSILTSDREVLESWEETVIPERKIVDSHGRERWLRIIKSPLLSEQGELEQVLAVALDITDQKEASLEHKQLRDRYEALVLARADFLWIANAEGEVTNPTESWLTHTGQSAKEMKGEGWLQAVHVDDRGRIQRKLKQAMETQVPFEIETRIRDKNFSYHYYRFLIAPVLNKQEDIVEWVGACSKVETM